MAQVTYCSQNSHVTNTTFSVFPSLNQQHFNASIQPKSGIRKMPTLSLVNFNISCATLGGFISAFGLVSFLCKETFYLSEARSCRCHITHFCCVIC